jgi:hypothetical protein
MVGNSAEIVHQLLLRYMHKVPPAVSVALQSCRKSNVRTYSRRGRGKTHPDTDIEHVIRKLQDTTIKETKNIPGTNGALDDRSVREDNTL